MADLHYLELVRELTMREIKSRYKQSVLAYAWVILNPFFQMLVMAFVFSKILRFPTIGVLYTIFLYAGLARDKQFTWDKTARLTHNVYDRVLDLRKV